MKTSSTALAFFLSAIFTLVIGQAAPVGSPGCTCDDPIQVATFNTLQIPIAGQRSERLTGTIDYFNTNNQNFGNSIQ